MRLGSPSLFIFRYLLQVQADVSAILMEEVLPSSVADAEAMGPEEVYSKKRGRDAEFLEGNLPQLRWSCCKSLCVCKKSLIGYI